MKRKGFEIKRKRGRPKGSKNKTTILREQGQVVEEKISQEKKDLIKEIKKHKEYHVDLKQYTIEQLQRHLNFIQRGQK